MITTVVNGVSVFLIPHRPDWRSGVSAEFKKRTGRIVGMSNREERFELAESLIASLSYKTMTGKADTALTTNDAEAFRSALRAWDNRPVLCPFWPAETLASACGTASVHGTLRVWFEPDWSQWCVNTEASPTFAASADCRTAPLMWGRFDDIPTETPINGDDEVSLTISVIENGSPLYALRPKSQTLVMHPVTVRGYSFPALSVPCVWGANQSKIDVRIKRETVGYIREDADTFYPQAVRKRNKLKFAGLNTAEVAEMLQLFTTVSGSVSPWFCPAPHSTSEKVFGRFYGDSLSFDWDTPSLGGNECASSQVEFLSLPTEEDLPAGETFGVTIGPQAAPWFGYKVTCGAQEWRFSSYESPLTGPGGTYESRPISHGTITEEINLAVNDCTLTVHAWTGCPFSMLIQQLNAAPIEVTIYEGKVADPAAALAIYTGTAMTPKTSGPKMTIKLKGPSAILKCIGPRLILQETCCAVLCDSRCKVDVDSIKVTASMLGITNGEAEMDIDPVTRPAGFFRNGYVERTVGQQTQRVMISDSVDCGNGHTGLILGSPILPAPTGVETWICVPGCDGYFSTCKTKFNNKLNFRGAPYVPKDNPSIIPLTSSSSGKK